MLTWRMKQPCDDCPFSASQAGRHLARSLMPGRLAAIKAGLRRGEHFICHKSIDYDERSPGTEKICAGAIAWQEQHGCSAQLVRIMERLDYLAKH